jgi:methylated-DNA-[protein]-cysteine S-methyltransferase
MKVSAELDRRFRDAALATGDLDVGYDLVETPLGNLFVAATPAGLCRIEYDPEPERIVDGLARSFGARVLRAPRSVDATRRQLDEYFEQRRTRFDLPIDLRVTEGFRRRVLDELALVPYGEVTTYGELAKRAEHPRAARAVGTIMNRNPIPIVLPCHRVVGASGSLTGYGGGLPRKEALLKLEGALL